MASVRVLTNETVGVAASTNNYLTFKMPAGNVSSLSLAFNAQIVFDVNVESDYCAAGAATALVGDVMVNYVDSLSGTYTTRSLSRESSLATSGMAIKQIPEVQGYALEALLLNSVNASGVGKDQFGASSRISLRDLNGNVYLGERSGIEYGMLAQQKWAGIPYGAETGGSDIPAAQAAIELTPLTHAVGVQMLDCRQLVGSAALYLQPDTASLDLDITAVYVQRNSASAKPSTATQLTTTGDSIGAGVTENPAIV